MGEVENHLYVATAAERESESTVGCIYEEKVKILCHAFTATDHQSIDFFTCKLIKHSRNMFLTDQTFAICLTFRKKSAVLCCRCINQMV